MVRETALTPADLIWPLFVIEGQNERTADHDHAGRRAAERRPRGRGGEGRGGGGHSGAGAVSQHAGPSAQREGAEEAYNPDNLMCRALSAIKDAVPEIGLIADVALDEYSSDGQDGLVRDGEILNDETVERDGASRRWCRPRPAADIIAPSDMMDGRVGAIRRGARCRGLRADARSWPMRPSSRRRSTGRSARRWARAARLKGDKRTYQLDYANSDEAMREVEQDIDEGADMVMVKPGHALSRHRPAGRATASTCRCSPTR